jgi:hypothetical protein
VPVTVTANVPLGVEKPVWILRLEEPPDATELGEKDAVAPAGKPLMLSATVSDEPLVIAVVTVSLPLRP